MNIRIPGSNKMLTLCEVIVNPNPTGSLVFLQTLSISAPILKEVAQIDGSAEWGYSDKTASYPPGSLVF